MRRLVVSDILKGLRKRKADNDEAAMNYKTVGLIGLCSGAGTTQLGIMLANYFSNGLHLKTAIVSAGFDDSFDRIKEEEQVGKVRNYAGSRREVSYHDILLHYPHLHVLQATLSVVLRQNQSLHSPLIYVCLLKVYFSVNFAYTFL